MKCFSCAGEDAVLGGVRLVCPGCGNRLFQCAPCRQYDDEQGYRSLFCARGERHFRGMTTPSLAATVDKAGKDG